MGLNHKDADPLVELLHRVVDEAAIFLIYNLPVIKRTTLEGLEAIFQTKAIGKQLALAIALETGMVTVNQVLRVMSLILSNFSSRSRLIRHLHKRQRETNTQDEWMDLAERIDHIQGDDAWRSEPNCKLYERDRISARVDEFVHLMRRRDIFELMFVLRGGIGRNKFGLLHEGLFSRALAGSKVLVETYHNVVCAALDFVCDAPVLPNQPPIPTDARLAFFNETRHSYGRTALLLSGGAALGFYHVGVVKTLIENRLMPRVLGGSSAGSIVCAMVGTRTDEECQRDFFERKGTDAPGHSGKLMISFFRPLNFCMKGDKGGVLGEVINNSAGTFRDAKRTWQIFFPIQVRQFTSVIFDMLTLKTRPQELLMSDSEHLAECMRTNIGDFTFQEAFDRTGRILNITVTPNNSSDPPRLLNYLTAPHVLVWSAAVASSSLPGVFQANRLMVKDCDGTVRYESAARATFSDGSMEQDLPMQQLSEMFNVNHFIISQANPHAVLFASYHHLRSVWTNPITGFINAVLSFLKDRCRSWIGNLVELVGARRIAPSHSTSRGVMAQFFVQEYEGRDMDISMIPWLSHRGLLSAFTHCLYNPSEDEFLEWIQAAERETWKHIPAIKSHIAEEVTLDRCVQRLRKRVVEESWEKRRMSSAGQKMGERVPSFFTSPSLVNLGGLNVGDQANLEGLEGYNNVGSASSLGNNIVESPPPITMPMGFNQGWGGLGLKGNRSSGNLRRSSSAASGLFIDADADADDQAQSSEQVAGEQTVPSGMPRETSSASLEATNDNYLKTSSMARFYYRQSITGNSYNSLPKSVLREENDEEPHHTRNKSKSHTDLAVGWSAQSK